MSRRHVAATNRFVCTGEFLWKSLSPQQNFVAVACRKKIKSDRIFCDKFSVAEKKIFTKILQYIQEAICRLDVSSQRVAATSRRTSQIEWFVAATCCCNLWPSVLRPWDHVLIIHWQKQRVLNTEQSTIHVVLCLFYTYWDIHHFASLFKNLSNTLKSAATHYEMAKKTKYMYIGKKFW